MRQIMHEDKGIASKKAKALNERQIIVESLLETWGKHSEFKGIINGLSESKKANLVVGLDNQRKYNKKHEAQISSNLGVTPENVLRLVALTDGQLVVDDIFHGKNLTTTRDALWYIEPVYEFDKTITKKDVFGNVVKDGDSTRPSRTIGASQQMKSDPATALADAHVTGTLTDNMKAFFCKVYIDGALAGTDDGDGSFVGKQVSGSIDYATGAYDVVPAIDGSVVVTGSWDYENRDNIKKITRVRAKLSAHYFEVEAMPINFAWSQLASYGLETTLNESMDDRLMAFASSEIVKARNIDAVTFGQSVALANGRAVRKFEVHNTMTGQDSYVDHAQLVINELDALGDDIYNELDRGGYSVIMAGTDACRYFKLSRDYKKADSGNKIGIHKIGSIDGKDIYKVPEAFMPKNRIITSWHNPDEDMDVAIAIGTLIPLYISPTITHANSDSEVALSYYGAMDALQSKYMNVMELDFTKA